MADERVNFVVSAQDRATATIARLKTELGMMGGAGARAAGPLGRLSAVTGGMVSPMTLGIGAAVGLTGAFFSTAQGASDLAEEMDKSRVVFGPASDEMVKFAESASDIGLSTQAALGAAGAFGNMFNTVGLAQGQSQDMSETMVQLASDMGSFNNVDPTEMLDKLRSGLSGEAEPLRQFGVLLSEAAVKTYAAQHGIGRVGEALTEAEKVTARYGLILDQTSIQQGNFADTADGLANSQRRWSAVLQNTSDEVGKMAASIVIGFMRVTEFLGTEVNPFTNMERDAQLAAAGMANTVPPAIAAMQEELRKGGPVLAAEAGKVAGMVSSEIQTIVDDARRVGEDAVLGLAAGIIAKQNDPLMAVEAMQQVFHESLSNSELIAKLTGEETMRMFRQGLRSDITADRVAAREALVPVIASLNSLGPAGRAAGLALMTQLGIGMRSAAPVGVRYARDAAGMITAVFPQSEPKDPQSPFRGITTWGGKIMDIIAGGIDGRGAAAVVRNSMGGMLPAFGGAMAPAYAGGGGYAAPMGAPLQIQVVMPDGRVLAEVVTREQYYQSPAGPSVLPRGSS